MNVIYSHELTGTAYCGLYMAVFSTKILLFEGRRRKKNEKSCNRRHDGEGTAWGMVAVWRSWW